MLHSFNVGVMWPGTGLTSIYSGRDTSTALLELLPGVPYRLHLVLSDDVGSPGVSTTVVESNFSVPESGACGNFDDVLRFQCVLGYRVLAV